MTFADAKQRFSTRVADYVRYRPSYPSALIDQLRTECSMRKNSIIADMGSGTGLLSKLFLENGNKVFGVEPNPEMRSAGEDCLRSFPNFTSVDGSAEATTLPAGSADFVTAGQAFHWFEPQHARAEFARILKPKGWVVIVWNERRVDTPFARDYESLLQRYGKDYEHVRESYPETKKIQDFFGNDRFLERSLPNAQFLKRPGLAGRFSSSSYAPQEGHPTFTSAIAELGRLFEAHQEHGRISMEYLTHIYIGRFEVADTPKAGTSRNRA